jgi:hypothetical protein
MRYVTIINELIQDRYPALHEQLRQQRMLLPAVNDHATALRSAHLRWKDELRQANPGLDPRAISGEALELALRDLQEALPCSSPPTADPDETFCLDAAMAFVRRATPNA